MGAAPLHFRFWGRRRASSFETRWIFKRTPIFKVAKALEQFLFFRGRIFLKKRLKNQETVTTCQSDSL